MLKEWNFIIRYEKYAEGIKGLALIVKGKNKEQKWETKEVLCGMKNKTMSTIIPTETELLSIACIKRVAEIFSFWLNIDGIFQTKTAAIYTNGSWISFWSFKAITAFHWKLQTTFEIFSTKAFCLKTIKQYFYLSRKSLLK